MNHKHLPYQKEGEKIILLLRRHPFILFTKLTLWGVVAAMPVALYLIIGQTLIPWFLNPNVFPIIVLFTTIYYLYIWLFTLHSFVDYYLDVWLVTSHRIVNTEQNGLFSRRVSEQQLHRIQDVTSETKGFFSTMLNYGTVHIQSAGETSHFIFKQIKDPRACAAKISKMVEENKKFHEILTGRDEVRIS